MAGLSVDEAHAALMSANPWSQYSGAVGLRNFAAAAQATADYLRTHGRANPAETGDAGVMAQEQAERHAQWFDQVAGTASTTADKLDTLVQQGYEHQTTAETAYSTYQQAVARDSGPNASGADDMALIHNMQSTSRVLNSAVDEWSSAYDGFTPADPPPPPSSTGTGTGATGGAGTSGGGTASGPHQSYAAAYTGGDTHSATLQPQHTVIGVTTLSPTRNPGDQGSITVGNDGGDFAGWFRDPTTGYYVDPSTGREFDPVTNRWVDPVTGKPFGDVTQYATGLQGLGGVSTSGGLLADTAATAGTGVAGISGAGGFAGLFSSGNTAAIAGGYGGMLPPSLSSGSAATGSLWGQGARSLAVKAQVAESMLAREQAARSGRAYLPPSQAGAGAGAGAAGARGRNRPGYLTAEEEEGKLFSSRGRQRTYLPPTQAGKGDKAEKDKDGRGDRPDWLVDDDVFAPDPAPTGILGD